MTRTYGVTWLRFWPVVWRVQTQQVRRCCSWLSVALLGTDTTLTDSGCWMQWRLLRSQPYTLYLKQHSVHCSLRVKPISLSYPFPLVVRVHVRVRASSGFDRGVGVRGRGRYPLKPSIFTSLLETKRYPEHTDPDHPESIFSLNTLFKMTTVLFCALHSPVHIYLQPCS